MSDKTEFQLASESAMTKLQRGGERASADEVIALTVRFPFYIQCVLGSGDPDLPNDVGELQRRGELAEKMIQEIEAGVQALRERVMRACSEPGLRVLSPFNRSQRNIRNNPLRNKYACRLAVLRGTLSQYPISENAYFYMLADEQRQKNTTASFRETDRTILSREDVSRASTVDALVTCHEIIHVIQDDVMRDAIHTVQEARWYNERLKFLSQRKRVVINGEMSPYTTELQIANHVLGGALQNPHSLSEKDVCERLGAVDPNQKDVGAILLRLARVFPGFERHQLNQPYPKSFVSELVDMYRSMGYEVIFQSPSGKMETR